MAKTIEETFRALDFAGQREMLDALTTIHQEAVDAERSRLMAELAKLGGPMPARATSKASATGEGRKRQVQFRGPNGEEWAGGGRFPDWAKDLGYTSKAEIEHFRVSGSPTKPRRK